MKKIALLLLLLINLSCEKEVLVEQEIKVSLINISPETSGNCSNGGYKIETGIDTNNNGILEANEVQSTNFICNGTNGNDGNNGNNGSNSLINISEEAEGDNCENEGYKIETGIDSNNNGILENNEVQSTNYICNGVNSLINIIEEPIGENCSNGGFKIETGIDIDNNGVLDTIEIENINFICNSNASNQQNGKIVTQASLTDGNILEITDFPYHIKKGISMSIYADLTLSGSVSYGKGYGAYRGDYFTIDATNIYWYSNSILKTTTAHGLTISTFLKSSFYVDDNGICYFVLQSLNGTFQTTFYLGYEMQYEPFIKTDGQIISNVKLSIISTEFQHSVWAFGDSYFGISNARVWGPMKKLGFFNLLINGLAGQSSRGAYTDFLKCLDYGTPKYLLWCLGMNDSDANYETYLSKVIDKCNSLNITLILTTIPTVPTRDHEAKKTLVESSGYRYIDWYKAVGTDAVGNWYSEYLSVDGVHPTVLGASALSMQFLIDFPELMQYGKTF